MGMSLGVHPPVILTPAELAENMRASYEEVFVSTLGAVFEGWTFEGTSVTWTIAGEPVIGESFQPLTGTAPEQTVTVNCALLVRKLTSSGGRKNRGRMYVPPFNIVEDDVSNAGVLFSGFVSGQTDGWNQYRDKLVTDDIFPAVLHSDPADAPTNIDSFQAQGLLATQRRRMR